MTYETFLKIIPDMVQEQVEEETQVRLHTIYKNNDQRKEALCILEPGCNVSPTIYLRPYFTRHEEGAGMSEILDEIMAEYQTNRCGLYLDVEEFQDFEKIGSRVVFKLINYEHNRELLRDVPHRRFLDLAVVYYFLIENHFIGKGTAMIHNQQLHIWNVDEDTLYRRALQNTDRLLGLEIKPMGCVIRELLKKDLIHQLSGCPGCGDFTKEQVDSWSLHILDSLMPGQPYEMYVLSNRDKYYGACAILNDKCLAGFASEHGSFYVIPSSIHEVILMPETESLSLADLKLLLVEINAAGEESQEYLSPEIYYYDSSQECLRV